MTTGSTATKRCITCGKDVTTIKRMKDSQGRYWCVDCGMADRRKKMKAASKSKSVSNSGGGVSLMERLRDHTGGGGAGGTDKGRLVKMLVAVAIMAAIAGWQFLSH
ncbi:MAG TPA: hypothetical protein VLI90_15060 [Tepidisphaeraceae bacterium]|nr:hypothetical protein [Tepidisphaeraceae bacterium]